MLLLKSGAGLTKKQVLLVLLYLLDKKFGWARDLGVFLPPPEGALRQTPAPKQGVVVVFKTYKEVNG
jgi:hypothetical protein